MDSVKASLPSPLKIEYYAPIGLADAELNRRKIKIHQYFKGLYPADRFDEMVIRDGGAAYIAADTIDLSRDGSLVARGTYAIIARS